MSKQKIDFLNLTHEEFTEVIKCLPQAKFERMIYIVLSYPDIPFEKLPGDIKQEVIEIYEEHFLCH
jgi:hypothetical protein